MKNPYLLQKVPVRELKSIPEIKGIYFIFDDNDILLYIGNSNNIRKRINHHTYGYSNWELYTRAKKVAWVEYLGDRTELEAQYIKLRKPILNIVHTCGR